MKTLPRILCIVAMIGGLPTASLFGQLSYHYAENSPVSGAGDASLDTFETGGQMTSTELNEQFDSGSSSTVPSSGSTATGTTATTSDSGGGGSQQIGGDVGGGTFEVNGQKAKLYTFKAPYSRKINERGTLELTLPVSFAVYEKAIAGTKDAQAYGIGLNAGYAWQAFLKKDNVPYRWKITPSTGLYYRDSSDLQEGAWVFNTGLSSSFAWQFAPGWVVNLGNSASFAWNSGIKSYPDPIRDSQQTVRNGVQLYRMLDRWMVYVYVMDTEALNDMIVDSYQTYGIGASYKLTKTRSLKATLLHEEGNGGYRSTRGSIGTSWEF
ncbi:MAG TPA: hypothetical protein VK968_18410 [Roseimicrobium sp.]|nr:hypothetical protein [Roseimicrobium sp.]